MKSLTDAQKARKIADEMQAETQARGGEFTDWFEELYAKADGDAGMVPWGDEKAHPGLVSWVEQNGAGQNGFGQNGRAIDVGCGLGDNAVFLAEKGFAVTAIDLSQSAIDWAARRFSDSSVDFRQADLFDLPRELVGQFDLVHETYTLQALPPAIRSKCYQAIASLVAPRGRLLVICRSRAEDQSADGPPWPLAKSELDRFTELGLTEISTSEFLEEKLDGRQIPHLKVEYQKIC